MNNYSVIVLGGTGQRVVQNVGGNQQILRIPVSSTSSVPSSGSINVGQLQKVQIGNKIQYVRVIPSNGQKSGGQSTTIRQTQPILPSTTKSGGSTTIPVSLKAVSGTGSQQVVKIALSSNYQQQPGVRAYNNNSVRSVVTLNII